MAIHSCLVNIHIRDSRFCFNSEQAEQAQLLKPYTSRGAWIMLSHFWCVMLYTLRDSHFVLFQASWDASSFWKVQWIKRLEGNDNSDPSTSLMCTWNLDGHSVQDSGKWSGEMNKQICRTFHDECSRFWCREFLMSSCLRYIWPT